MAECERVSQQNIRFKDQKPFKNIIKKNNTKNALENSFDNKIK